MDSNSEDDDDEILLHKWNNHKLDFSFPKPSEKLESPVILLENITFGYDRNEILFDKLNFLLDANSRIAVVGPNGIGKSTLLKLICGYIRPISGEKKTHKKLKIGYWGQQSHEILNGEKTPIELLMSEFHLNHLEAKKYLQTTGLPENMCQLKIKNLSGGTKSKIILTCLSLSNPHVLLLDEPTNNLDIESYEALINAINEYEGGVLIVTHDKDLIKRTNCKLLIIEDKVIKEIEGRIEDYYKEILDNLHQDS